MTKRNKTIAFTAFILSFLLSILLIWRISGKSAANTASELPAEARNALQAYLHCDSPGALADCILPSSAAAEAKNGKGIAGDYSFFFSSAVLRDETILTCSRLPQDQAERIGAFWSAGFSMQGFSADFTAEDGYDVLVSACCSVQDESDAETSFKVTRRLEILKIKQDRWIVIPSSDQDSNSIEPIL